MIKFYYQKQVEVSSGFLFDFYAVRQSFFKGRTSLNIEHSPVAPRRAIIYFVTISGLCLSVVCISLNRYIMDIR